MEIGFLTSCFPQLPFEEVVRRASQDGFKTLEVSAWPKRSDRSSKARHLPVEYFNKSASTRIQDLCSKHRIRISALAYYENLTDPHPERRKSRVEHLYAVIRAASLLDVGLVGTFVGAHPGRTPAENMKEIGKVFRRIMAFAEDHGVRVMIENCPMMGWQKPGLPGNYAYSPELWERLFHEVPSEHFGLNFDPSHLVWLGIDYGRCVRDFSSRIFHVHAKDCEIDASGLIRYGVMGRQLPDVKGSTGWWRYRIPGKGSIDWREFVQTLRSVGYDRVLSIELEDPDWEESDEAAFEGLKRGREFLERAVHTKP